MRCPSKHNTLLIPELTIQGVEVDHCKECGGIWLDKGELFYFVKNPKLALKKFLYALENKQPSKRISPRSLRPMVEIEYPDGPKIDYCEESGGIWLEKNELEEIVVTDQNLDFTFDKYKVARKNSLPKKLSLPYYFFRSFLAILGMYMPLMIILFSLMFFTEFNEITLLSIISAYALIIFAFSGRIMDLMLRKFFAMRFINEQSLPKHISEFLQNICKKHNLNVPQIGIIEDNAPQIFCYGATSKYTRLIITRGALETLTERELIALIAHEIGHISNKDVILMTAAQIIPLSFFYFYRIFWYKTYKTKRVSVILSIFPALIFYILYYVTQFPILWYSRIREFYADKFAGENIENPADLASALVKVAYGIAAKDTRSDDYPVNIEAAGAMGIFDKNRAINLAINSYPNQYMEDINKDLLKKAMRWDLWNPWAKFYEFFSTHPLVARRIINLIAQSQNRGKEPFLEFTEQKPESYLDEFFTDATILYLPKITALMLAGISIFLYLSPNELTNFSHMTLATLITALGVSMLLKDCFHFKGALFPITQVSSLLKKVKVSKIRPVPCTLQGKIIGQGIPGFLASKDYIFEDESGIILLDSKEPIRFWEKLFSILDKDNFHNKEVIIEGWYYRDSLASIVIASVTYDGRTIYSNKKIWNYLISGATLFIGLGYFTNIMLGILY